MARFYLGNIKGEPGEVTTQQLLETIDVVESKINDISLNVKNYGAKGNGVDDDSEHINNALSSGHKKIYIPHGEYVINQTLNITSNDIILYGEGVIISNADVGLDLSGNNCNVQFNIDGGNVTRVGINVSGENNIIHDSTVKNIYSNSDSALGINVYNNNNTVENCYIDNVESVGNDIFGDSSGASRGIRVSGLDTNNGITLIKNNVITNIIGEEGDAIHLIAPDKDKMEVIVEGNKIHTFSRRGIKIQCSDTKIINNVIENYTDHTSLIRAIDIQGVDNTMIMNNTLTLEYIPCFGLAGTEDKPVNNTVISNNTVKMLTKIATVYTTYVNNFEFTGNKIEGGGSNIFNRANKVKIVNNIFDSLLTESSDFPISVMQSGDDVLIMNNTVSNSTYHRPLRSNATNVKIIGNNFTDYSGGIELSSTGSGFVVNNVIKASNVISTSPEGYTVENNVLI